MDPATALIVVGAVLLAAPLGIWLRGRIVDPPPPPPPPPPPEQPPPPPPSEQPVLRVVALGLEGAGKTVLLAGMFHTLSALSPDRRFFLDVEWGQEQRLVDVYQSLCDTSAGWPMATRIGQFDDVVFGCMAHDRAGAERRLFEISYLDYAGELLESEPLEESDDPLDPATRDQGAVKELKAKVHGADALLLMLDGRRMLQWLRGEEVGTSYFEWRIAPLLAVARRAKCPVQLILTKWDLVCAFDDSGGGEPLLRDVKQKLMANGRVDLMVRAHLHRNEEVRLIPVSAFGSNFADPDADWEMVKRPKGRVEPLHVDVPLCAVLPDVLKHLERELSTAIREDIKSEIRRHKLRDVSAIAYSVLTSRAGTLLQKALGGLVGPQVVKLFVELLVREELPVPADPVGPGQPDAEVIQRLRADVVGDMYRIVGRLERDYPSSILSIR